MKRGEKRGLSLVVTTVIMVALVLVAVGIIWFVINNLISESAEDISIGGLTLDLQIKKVVVGENIISVTVKRNAGKGNLVGLKFVVKNAIDSQIFERDTTMSELQEETFILDYSGEVETISIAPIYETDSGKRIVGNIVSVYNVGTGKESKPDIPEPYCGDGNIDSGEGEVCDGDNLGGQTCASLGYDSGILSCKLDCTFDTSGCEILISDCWEDGDNNYEICTCDDLNKIRLDLTGNYVLMNDIGCDVAPYNTGEGFVPVGDASNPPDSFFSGSLDGRGYNITDLMIYRSSISYVGLFGYTSGSTISNVNLINVNITGADYVGGLVGYGNNITNCSTSGIVTGIDDYVGGLVGYVGDASYLTINSSSSANVTGDSYVGGLIGYSSGATLNSYATGYVVGLNTGYSLIGGLMGFIDGDYGAGEAFDCYATGNVTGAGDSIGGLIGYIRDNSNVKNTYATGYVSGDDYVGGLVGSMMSAILKNSFSTGNVSGDDYVGGLVGADSMSTFSNLYWYNSAGNPSSCFGSGGFGCTAKTDLNWFYSKNNAPMSSWDFDAIWEEQISPDDFPTLIF